MDDVATIPGRAPDRIVNASKVAAARPIHVLHVPVGDENPYHRELSSHLRALGVRVTLWSWYSGLVRKVLVGPDRPDIVHLHWLVQFTPSLVGVRMFFSFLARVAVIRICGRRIVWTAHNLYHHERRCRWFDRVIARWVIAHASKIIAHSPSAGRLVAKEFHVRRREKLVVVPHGNYTGCYPDLVTRGEARRRLQLAPETMAMLFFGQIRPYKGVSELIEAFQRLRAPSARLIIAGRPLDESTAVSIARTIRPGDAIDLNAAFVPDEDVQVYLKACDVVVFPYRDVLTSGALILAMSFGRACIAPSVGCITDVLDGRGAFAYDPDDPDGLRDALAAAVEKRGHLETMGAHNLERTRAWGWDRVARETAAVYAAVLHRPMAAGAS